MLGGPVWAWLLLVVSVIAILLAGYTYSRHWGVPGVAWLVGMHLTVGAYTLVHVPGAFMIAGDETLLALEYLGFTLSVTAALFWFVFVASYTGVATISRRLSGGILAALGALAFLNLTGPVHGLLFADATVVQTGSAQHVQTIPYLLYIPQVVGVFAAAALGIGILFRMLRKRNQLFSGQAVALIVGSVAPFLAGGLDLLNLEPDAAMPLIPFGFVAMSIAFTYAVFHEDLFEVVPATQTIGKAAALEQLDTGLVIVTAEGRVIDANERACELLDTPEATLIGATLDDVTALSVPHPTALPGLFEYGGRTLQTNVTPIETGNGDELGYTVRCTDISDAVRREQRLEVMHRVLRHNVRNDLAVVDVYANQLATTTDPLRCEEYAEQIDTALDSLLALTEKARSLEAGLSDESVPQSVDIGRLADEILADLPVEERGVAVEWDLPPDSTITTHIRQLRIALENVLENAVEHMNEIDPRLRLSVTETESGVEITVSDNGPGIPQHELDTLETGTETELKHGSGLGLWLVTWAVQDLGGEVEFESSKRGTTVRITVPERDPDAYTQATATHATGQQTAAEGGYETSGKADEEPTEPESPSRSPQ